ncbi:unnamed protein product [Camellia sinensis]
MFYLIYILVYYLESDNGGQRESERRTARRQKTKETMTIDKKEQICEIERERDDLPETICESERDRRSAREREEKRSEEAGHTQTTFRFFTFFLLFLSVRVFVYSHQRSYLGQDRVSLSTETRFLHVSF